MWRVDAEQAEAAGEWKLALRARYRWLLGELIDRQLLVNVPGRTPGEYRTELARIRPDQATAFATATDLFERAWYGNEPTGPDENRQFRSCAEQVHCGGRASARMTGSRRGLFWVALVVVVVIGFAVVGRGSERSAEPLAPDSTSPSGIRGLVMLVESFGADVDVIDGAPA